MKKKKDRKSTWYSPDFAIYRGGIKGFKAPFFFWKEREPGGKRTAGLWKAQISHQAL